MIVRRATHADAAAIARVHVASWREVYGALLPAPIMETNTAERRRALWDRILAAGERRVLVAVGEGTIVGFICGGPMPESFRGRAPIVGHDAYVDAIYVLAGWHGRGIGRALLGTLAGALVQDGFHSLALHVVGTNPARRFYEHLGARFLFEEPITAGVDEGMQCAYGWSDLRSVPTGTSQWTVQPRGGEPQPDCT
jgi:ribosomal protein S18 acetylase RimI-like enzyme